MSERYIACATVVGIGMLMAIFFMIFTQWADAAGDIEALEFDLDTITA